MFRHKIFMSMTKATVPEERTTAVHAYVRDKLTDTQIDYLCAKMAINRKYQFKWYMNNPRRWPAQKAVAFATVMGLALSEAVTTYEVGYDELASVLDT